MQANDEQYRLLVETSPDGLLLTDLDGTILTANAAAAKLHGAESSDELLGRSVSSLCEGEDRDHVRAMMKDALQSGRVRNGECHLEREDDAVIAEFQIAAVKDEVENPAGFVHVMRDITRQRQREEQLRDQALHDALTGLPNRVLFHDRLAQAIEIARRTKTQVAVLYIDLDYFKEVNDTFGHDKADLLLQQVAHRMSNALRASDTLARLGGDEFAAVLPQADASGARVTAGKLKEGLDRSIQIGEHGITMGASIGIAIYPIHGDDPTTILRRADVAMYAAKQSGRRNMLWRPEQEALLGQQHIRLRDSAVPVIQVDPRVLSMALGRQEKSGGAARVPPSE